MVSHPISSIYKGLSRLLFGKFLMQNPLEKRRSTKAPFFRLYLVLDIAPPNSGLTAHNIIISHPSSFSRINQITLVLFELFPGAKATVGF